ncbi:MAG: oxidoreductase [Propionicimonas sp.]
MTSIYEAAGGTDGMLALAHAWHERCLADPVAAHPFSHGVHDQHLERLAAYWGEALGGPASYTASVGTETGVLRMHAGNGEHADLDERAVACFAAALDDVGYTGGLRQVLYDYFAWSTIRMAAHPDTPDTVPDDVPLPHWGWTGSQ